MFIVQLGTYNVEQKQKQKPQKIILHIIPVQLNTQILARKDIHFSWARQYYYHYRKRKAEHAVITLQKMR
jgi:hypothetical protein